MKHLVLLTILLWSGFAKAQTMVYETADGEPVFKITYPAGWTLDLRFDEPRNDLERPPPPRVVEAMPSDGSLVWLGIWIPPGVTNFTEAKEYLDSLEHYILTDVKADTPRTEQLNGMAARIIEGTAKKDKEEVKWVMAFFQPVENVIGAALYVAVPAAAKSYQSDLDALVASLRPIKRN